MKAEAVDLLTAMGLGMRRRGDLGRARAYMRAANAIARRDDFDELLAKDRLRAIPGIGPSIERTLKRFAETGERPDWAAQEAGEAGEDEGLAEIPPAFFRAPFADAPDLHVHTTWSDGSLTLDEVVAFAKRLGAKAIGISDHSGSLGIARGLKPDEVRAQWADIARVQAAHPDIRILKGTECDILRDGTLDHPKDILRGFDYVIGSVHSQLRLPRKEQTARMLAALDQEHLTVLGHPTTRVPNRRPRADLDLPRVFEKAAERRVALEVNGNPGRIDLDVDLAVDALAAGARLSLASDGHSAYEMLSFAIARTMAEEAGAKRDDLVNYDLLERHSPKG